MTIRVVLNQKCSPCVEFKDVAGIIELSTGFQIIFTTKSWYYKQFNKLTCIYKSEDVKHIKVL